MHPKPVKFRAVTWNLLYRADVKNTKRALKRIRRRKVSVFLVQEADNPKARDLFSDAGLEWAYLKPELLLAWDPKVWAIEKRAGGRQLSRTAWYRGDKPIYTKALDGVLRHKASGLTLHMLTYHTPAGLDRGGPSPDVPLRVQSLMEAMRRLGELADASPADAVLFGGDDNVDEDKSPGKWPFMRRRRTGLRQVRAPKPTHGHPVSGRMIDDFRIRGLRIGRGWVLAGGGDHRAHVRTFTFH